MYKKIALCGLGLVAAVGCPWLCYKVAEMTSQLGKSGNAPAVALAGPGGTTAAGPHGTPAPLPPGATGTTSDGVPIYPLADALRFDLTPQVVMNRWPRVTTGLAELQLHGYRVPLVTGTADADVAGSLTYYFNPRQQVQRISLRGTTGDVRQLTGFLTARYKFAYRMTNDPGLWLFERVNSSGKRTSFAEIRPAPVLKANDPRHRFDVTLVIERPEAG